jgi:tRNA(fMet)-specific endonuclease VapC
MNAFEDINYKIRIETLLFSLCSAFCQYFIVTSCLQDGDVVISLVTFGELLNGALKSNQSDIALKKINQLASILPVQEMTVDVARIYANIRRNLEQKGKIVGANDLWIAAHAVALDLTLVTNNTKEFSCVDGLRTDNWV